jgi:hypothetical protein
VGGVVLAGEFELRSLDETEQALHYAVEETAFVLQKNTIGSGYVFEGHENGPCFLAYFVLAVVAIEDLVAAGDLGLELPTLVLQFARAFLVSFDVIENGIGVFCLPFCLLPQPNPDLVEFDDRLAFLLVGQFQFLHVVAPVDDDRFLAESFLHPLD